MQKLGIIGGGNMGEAIIERVRPDYPVLVSEKDSSRQECLKKNLQLNPVALSFLLKEADIILIAVKPQDMEGLLKEISPALKTSQLIISIAAGVTTLYIEKRLPKKTRVIRTMPNMPAMVGEGITAICAGKNLLPDDLTTAQKIFEKVGETVIVKEEAMDAVTAISGSGPAYVYLFMECLMKSAVQLGLDEKLAARLVVRTFLGGAVLIHQKKADPAVLRAKVTSKGGTTQAAMDVFMKSNIDDTIAQAVKAAKKRSQQLSH